MVALRRRWAQRTIFPLITLLKVGTEGDRERERERAANNGHDFRGGEIVRLAAALVPRASLAAALAPWYG